MMEPFSAGEKQNVVDIVKDEYCNTVVASDNVVKTVDKGLRLLEKLINCNIKGYMDSGDSLKSCCTVWNGKDLSRFELVEGVMMKLVALYEMKSIKTGEDISGKDGGFAQCYCLLHAMEKLNATCSKYRIRGNSLLHQFYKDYCPEENVDLSTNKNPWDDCSLKHAKMFIYAWQYRNVVLHPEIKVDREDYALIKKCFFTVLLEVCIANKKLIEECYLEELEKSVRPVFDAKKKELRDKGKERETFFQETYVKLNWGTEGEDIPEWNEKHKAILLIGEAGAGKTTQMERLYWDELCSDKVAHFPIWIKIQELKTKNLLDEIKDKINDLNSGCRCEEALREGLISLYLDGLNELLVDDRRESAMKLANTIQYLMNEYENLHICMTDRTTERLGEVIEAAKVTVYKCESMDKDTITDYCERHWGIELATNIIVAVDSAKPQNAWFWSEEHRVIPEKVNGLAEMIRKGNVPTNEDEYYQYYIEHILKREIEKKHDKLRVLTLKKLLYKLTVQFDYEEMFYVDVSDCFKNNLSGDEERAAEYFELACQLLLLVESNEKYVFNYYGYYKYFSAKENIR